MLEVVGNETAQDGVDGRSLLDEIAREGARRVPAAALAAEVTAYREAQREERDKLGHVPVPTHNEGSGVATKGLPTAYTLLDMAQARWRRLDLLPGAGVRYVDGLQHATRGRRPSARAA